MSEPERNKDRPPRSYSLVLHGGANNLTREDFDKLAQFDPVIFHNLEARITAALRECCSQGEQILKKGGTALEAVVATVSALEDNPLFNAGHGSCPDRRGQFKLDASLMDGETRKWGSVALVDSVPIQSDWLNSVYVVGDCF